MKLNFKEKIILAVFVFIVTLLVGAFIVVKPTMQTISDNKKVLSEKQVEKVNVISSINSLDTLKKDNETKTKEIDKLNEFFIPQMFTCEIDKYVYEIAKKNSISIDDMVLVPTLESDLGYYNPLDLLDTKSAEPNILKTDCTTANITFVANQQVDVENFLDAIDTLDKSVVVDLCSIEYDESNHKYNATIGISFYSVVPGKTLLSE